MGNQSDLAALRRDREKHEAALASASEKISAIEEAERRRQEEKEAKAREFGSLQRKLERSHGWVLKVGKDVAELKKEAAREIDLVAEGHGVAVGHLRSTLLELTTAELELAAFKEYEISIRAKIEAQQ